MDDSQKKAPRKADRNNSSKQMIFEPNDDYGINNAKGDVNGNNQRFTEGIELDNIYNDEKPLKVPKKQTKL